MNFISPHKFHFYKENLEKADVQVAEAAISGVEENIRTAVDARRQARSHLEREAMATTNSESIRVDDVYKTNAELTDFVKLWCDRLKSTIISTEFLENVEYCHLFIDCFIPETWDWDKDLVILIRPHSKEIIQTLFKRGQKNVAIYSDDKIMLRSSVNTTEDANLIFCEDTRELADAVSKINNRVRQVTTLHCDPLSQDAKKIQNKVQKALVLGRKVAQVGVNTRSKFSKSWVKNALKNLDNLATNPGLDKLEVRDVHDAVIISPGPSLEKNIEELSRLKESVFIVSPLRCVQILGSYGITPDLVVQIDALEDECAAGLNIQNAPPIRNLLLEGTVNPSLFQIKADNIFWTLQENVSGIHKLLDAKPTPFTAPSVALFATYVCKHFGFQNICLLGQDLSASGNTVYAKGATDFLPEHGNPNHFTIPVKGFWGGTVYTRSDYEFYIEQYSITAELWKTENPDINLVNCTEGGAFIDGFRHISLHDYSVERRLRDLKATKNLVFPSVSRRPSKTISEFKAKLMSELRKIVKISDAVIAMSSDLGRNRGFKKKRSSLIKQFQEIQNRTRLLELAMQEEITQVVGNASKTITRPNYEDFFRSVKTTSTELLDTLKQ